MKLTRNFLKISILSLVIVIFASVTVNATSIKLAIDEFRGKDFNGEWPTFPEMLQIQVKRNGDRPYFTDFEGSNGSKNTLTYNQVFEKVTVLANWLIANGIKKGDKVVVSGKNSPEWGVVYLATLYASGIIVPVDNGLHEPDVCKIIKRSEPKIAIVDSEKIDFLSKEFPSLLIKSLNSKKDDYIEEIYDCVLKRCS